MKVLLENIRSFYGRHEIQLTPLTILVGENSAGKSTFLALANHVLNGSFIALTPKLNSAPYELGNFNTICSKQRSRKGAKIHTFALGYKTFIQDQEVHALAHFGNSHGVPTLETLSWRIPENVSLTTKVYEQKYQGTVTLHDKEQTETAYDFLADLRKYPAAVVNTLPLGMLTLMSINAKEQKDKTGIPSEHTRRIFEALTMAMSHRENTVCMAPVRSKPKRTYDESIDAFNPEGDHVPYTLARLDAVHDDEAVKIETAINEFGSESGLFSSIGPKTLDKRVEGGPFQIIVNLSGPKHNLIDVGYGVSQALPIVVESARAQGGAYVLIQQPEVHLHPKAQAALGTFFARMVNGGQRKFIVETHSDFLLDRIRLEVARKTISHTDCSILYFERKREKTRVHQIALDALGNITKPPKSYRQFFLAEGQKLYDRAAE